MLCLLCFTGRAQETGITLQQCLDLSRAGSVTILNSALDVRAAKAQKEEAFTLWFPTVSASAYGFHALNPLLKIGLDDVLGNGEFASKLIYYAEPLLKDLGMKSEWTALNNGYIASVNVSQPLFAGGRIANGNALAALGVKAADAKNRMAVRDNDDNVTGKYWTVVALSEKRKALQQAVDLVSALEKDVIAAVAAGVARESDHMQVQLKARDLESKMIQLRSGERLAKMDLFNTVGLPFKVLEIDDMVLSDGFAGLLPPEQYYSDEAGVAASLDESRLLEMSVEAKRLEKKMAVGESLPQVGLGASWGYGRIVGNPRMNGAVYAMVKVPLSDWWKTSRKIVRCNAELEKAQNEKEFLDRQLVLKVDKEWIDLKCAWEKIKVAEESVSLAEMMEGQKHGEYEAGLCTLSELLQCQTELQSVRSALADAQAEYCTALSVWNKQ